MFKKLVQKGNAHKTTRKARMRSLVIFGLMAVMMLAMTVTAFAAEPVETAVTTEMVQPIVDHVIANIAAIMPVAIAVFGVMIGLALVPRIIRRYTSA